TRSTRDWSSDVCSSDLEKVAVFSPSVTTVEQCTPLLSTVMAMETMESPPSTKSEDPSVIFLEHETATHSIAPTRESVRPPSTERSEERRVGKERRQRWR